MNSSITVTAPSQCSTGFSNDGVCISAVNAAVNSNCVSSSFPNCYCVNNVCTIFPPTTAPVWAIAVLATLGALVLALVVWIICLYKKKGASEEAETLVYKA